MCDEEDCIHHPGPEEEVALTAGHDDSGMPVLYYDGRDFSCLCDDVCDRERTEVRVAVTVTVAEEDRESLRVSWRPPGGEWQVIRCDGGTPGTVMLQVPSLLDDEGDSERSYDFKVENANGLHDPKIIIRRKKKCEPRDITRTAPQTLRRS